ncbi:35188_t:CDS:2 [Gigaspora margarita]|uniref:35188_t:CDS:1 n=1 Tax=Gigaspora margarita TaxID=4874 RepID=A0ABM8W541_GIGMA|nr:35188_t:CDS:2 [Gigaspora margarita]
MSSSDLSVNNPEAQHLIDLSFVQIWKRLLRKIKNRIWYKAIRIGENKLKSMLQQIVINTEAFDVPKDEAMIFSSHHSYENLKSYYSFLSDSYVNYESDENEELG